MALIQEMNAWATDLQSDYPPLADNYLYTAPFDVKAYRCYELSFWHWFETEENFDGGNIEFTLDDGQTWQVLGSDQDSSWYNTPYVQALDAIYPGFSGSSGGWIKAFKRFSIFGDGRVQFRFRFASTATIHGEGWMIDDICFEQVSGNCQSIGQGDFPPVLSTMQLYPNPVGEELSIVLPETHRSSGHIEIKITNAMGATVLMVRRDLANDQHYNIDVSALAPGSYTVEVTSDQARSVGMFIKR